MAKLDKFLFLSLICWAINSIPIIKAFSCSENFFDCGNGKCIADFFRCDGDNDCGNFNDELHCNRTSNLLSFLGTPCPKDHFSCNDDFKTCIPKRWVCDGIAECLNKADEMNCTGAKADCKEDFMCKNFECIPKIWRCDGIFDCDDKSDEHNCTVFHEDNVPCDKEHGMFKCSTGECIEYIKVCDQKKDCMMGDDEESICHAKKCDDKKCSHLCLIDPKTNNSVCSCPSGYRLVNNTNCIDYDECADNKLTNLCSQRCINLEGHYKCECFEDYQQIENATCEVKGKSPVLYFSSGKEIRSYNLRKSSLTPLVKAQRNELIVAIDFFIKYKRLYYSSIVDGFNSTVYEISVEPYSVESNNQPKVIFQDSNSQIEGISVDWLGHHLYMTESNRNRIIVCNTDSLLCTTLIENISSPRGILVLPLQATLFWSQWGNDSGIFTSLLDGTDIINLFRDVDWPNGLTFDVTLNRLYWSEGKLGLIEYYDFDTKVRHQVYQDSIRQPYSLVVFEDKVYWSDWTYQELISCNKIHCHHHSHPLMQQFDTISNRGFFGMAIYHSMLQNSQSTLINPCRRHSCSHICLIKNPSAYTCKCPDHMKLMVDNRTCTPKLDQQFLIINTGFKLYRFYPYSIVNSFQEIPMTPSYTITELTYNYDRDEIYYYDSLKNRIGSISLRSLIPYKHKLLVDFDIDSVYGLSYDVNTNNIYWVDMSKGTLEVANIIDRYRAILNQKLHKPISLTISAATKNIYVGLRSTSSQIVELSMYGKFKKVVVSSDLGLPLALTTLSNGNELIWGDPIMEKIDFLDLRKKFMFDKKKASKLIETRVDSVQSIVVINSTVYWTNSESPSVFYLSINSIAKRVKLKSLPDKSLVNQDVLKIASGLKQPLLYKYCQTKMVKPCPHLCLIGDSGPLCKCSLGYDSNDNGKVCKKSSSTKTKPFIVKILSWQDLINSMLAKHLNKTLDDWIVGMKPSTSSDLANSSSLDFSTTIKIESTTQVSTSLKFDSVEQDLIEKSNEIVPKAEPSVKEFDNFIMSKVIFVVCLIIIVLIFFKTKLYYKTFDCFADLRSRWLNRRRLNSNSQVRFFSNNNFQPSINLDSQHQQNNNNCSNS